MLPARLSDLRLYMRSKMREGQRVDSSASELIAGETVTEPGSTALALVSSAFLSIQQQLHTQPNQAQAQLLPPTLEQALMQFGQQLLANHPPRVDIGTSAPTWRRWKFSCRDAACHQSAATRSNQAAAWGPAGRQHVWCACQECGLSQGTIFQQLLQCKRANRRAAGTSRSAFSCRILVAQQCCLRITETAHLVLLFVLWQRV